MALLGTPGAIAKPPADPSKPPWKVFTYGGFAPTKSATLPGRMSENTPKPVRSTNPGANCQAMAVRGCHSAQEVAGNRCVSPVSMVAFNGSSTSCGSDPKDPGSRAMRSCGFSGLELCARRTPTVQFNLWVSLMESCAYKSTFR